MRLQKKKTMFYFRVVCFVVDAAELTLDSCTKMQYQHQRNKSDKTAK